MVNQIEASVMDHYPDILQYSLNNGIVPQAYLTLSQALAEHELLTLQFKVLANKYGKLNVGQFAIK